MALLTSTIGISGKPKLLAYDRHSHQPGIVHFGLGAFHRAHQAVYTDDALASAGGDWQIIGVSLRSTHIADVLNAQDRLYSLLIKGDGKPECRIIGSIAEVIAASNDRPRLLSVLADPTIRIVSLTVTEKAYGIDQAGKINLDDATIAADLKNPKNPTGVIGFIVEGLRQRKEAGIDPFTVLCCDNLPENGKLVRNGVIDFATRLDEELANWIAEKVSFPSTMVDRITPAATEETLKEARQIIGADDHAAVETEPFTQWVIEDDFPMGRPEWEAGGAIFVRDVAPYEAMKLRMLNGSHSLIAYAGFLAGCQFVRDTMKYKPLANLVSTHMKSAAKTLQPVDEIDLASYEDQLLERFANPSIAHETYQIAMDGTQKLPQRLLQPAQFALEHGQDIQSFAFAIAAWMRYCLGVDEAGNSYELRDPREAEIKSVLDTIPRDASHIVDALEGLSGLIPDAISGHEQWKATVRAHLEIMLESGMRAAIEQFSD